MRGRRAVAVAVAALALACACDALTGAGSFQSVACLPTSSVDSCTNQCAAAGGHYDTSSGSCTCTDGEPICGDPYAGGSCCAATSGGLPSTCVDGGYCEIDSVPCGSYYCTDTGTTCLDPDAGICGVSYGLPRQSCSAGLTCGSQRDCCVSVSIPGGSFSMGREATGKNQCPASDTCSADETPAHSVTVSPFQLDAFEVTVGRFRAFVERWDYAGIPVGAGTDPNAVGTSWDGTWNAALPATATDFQQDLSCAHALGGPAPALATWTSARGANEERPINCVTWYEAFAFCVWDGGRLPTEAEWELAAASGASDNLYPWGGSAPSEALATYDCGADPTPCATSPSMPGAVGSLLGGANGWGNLDLAGNVSEWTRDSYAPYPSAAETDPARTESGDYGFPVFRGGSFRDGAATLRAAARAYTRADVTSPAIGVRCAR